MTEPNKPLDQMTVQERLDLGRSYYEDGRFDEAIKTWSSIRREKVDSGTYAGVQLNLGNAYLVRNKLDDAIAAWSNIHREDNSKAYAYAQVSLGLAYKDRGKLDEAVAAWSNIHREDNSKAYAYAQLKLGAAYYAQDKLDEAVAAWSNIHRDDDSENYTDAQFNLGLAYHTQGKLDDAIAAWSNIHREDNSKAYAYAQVSLGLAYKDRGKLDEAVAAWSNIHREDNSKAYAYAQLNLGNAYQDQGKLDEAITAWSNIHREKADSETYAWAQFNLGNAYQDQGKLNEAITAWSNIHREAAGSETYAWAQLNLGAAYYTQEDWKQAIKTWSNIRREDDSEAYARAQYGLGKIYENKGNIKQAKEAYRNAREFFYYEGERGYRIHRCPPEIIKKLRDIAKNTDEVLKSLQIIPDFESQVAHYSRALTAFTLLEKKRNNQKPSHFRLSTIRGVNDPTEGLVLGKYWDQQGISETIHTNDTATFISCFTFNHDSLNQFRLYGKEDGREATGVSLVFNEKFFSEKSDVLEFIAGPSTNPSSKSKQVKLDDTGKTESDNKKPLIGKSTLYRCIYLDPETGYWTLAQRDKSTFYREHNEDEDTDAKGKWEDYYELISKIEGCVETRLFNKENNEDTDTKGKRGKYHESISTKEEGVETHLLNKENNDDNSVSSILKSIFTEDHSYNKCNKYEKQKILEAIRFILLPLQYLVKHIAFQEEQECRIIYITQFRDKKIHSNREEQKMYVEYKEEVLPHIDKIWLSPGAAKYQDFFRLLLDKEDNDNKVRISQNPFRNKE